MDEKIEIITSCELLSFLLTLQGHKQRAWHQVPPGLVVICFQIC